jgi:hypothetical protein
MSNTRMGTDHRWENSIRDCNGAFGLDPSKQYLVRRGVQPFRDLINWLVHGTTRLARDRAVAFLSGRGIKYQTSEREKKRGRQRLVATYVKAEYASETMPWDAV